MSDENKENYHKKAAQNLEALDDFNIKNWLIDFFFFNFLRKGVNKLIVRWKQVINNSDEYLID